MSRSESNIRRQVIAGIELKAGKPGHLADFHSDMLAAGQQLVDALKPYSPRLINAFAFPPAEAGAPVNGVVVLQLGSGSAAELMAAEKPPGVRYWERNAPMALCGWNDPLFAADQWGLKRIGALDGWNTPVGSKVAIAIIDSGVMWRWDPTGTGRVVGVHEDLDGRMTGEQFPPRFWRSAEDPPMDGRDDDRSGAVDDFNGGRLIEMDRDGLIGDENGHGTMLAGVMFATPDNARGLASPLTRYWPNITMMPIKFFDADSRPTPDNAAMAIAYAVDQGARVINASWHVGPGQHGLKVMRDAVAHAREHKVLIAAAAGNDGSDNDEFPTYPANLCREFDNVLSVHATDRRDQKTSFSNYGRTTVHFGAPGLRIMTTGRYVANRPVYRAFSGTSASTAFGSLAAALVMAAEEARSGRLPTPREVIAHLLDTADRFPALRACSMSGKRLNLEHAVRTPVPWVGGSPQGPP
jgi:subtilisin family serine protease